MRTVDSIATMDAVPIVKTRSGERRARGFSTAELEEAGITDMHVARRGRIPIDVWRSTRYPENIDKLKSLLTELMKARARRKEEKSGKSRKIESSPKETEGEKSGSAAKDAGKVKAKQEPKERKSSRKGPKQSRKKKRRFKR